VDVPRSIGQISRLCTNDPFLAPIATAATTDGQRVLMLTGHEGPAGLFSREVRVSVGTCHGRGGSLVVPMEWEAIHFSRLFPMLSGDLELAPLGPHSCRIILSASYAVPLGEVGRRLDRLVLHGVAESTVRSFLQRLALALERPEGSPVARAPRDGREAAVPACRLAS
jgi:hypothetical protein